jgi:hypothetical protein
MNEYAYLPPTEAEREPMTGLQTIIKMTKKLKVPIIKREAEKPRIFSD